MKMSFRKFHKRTLALRNYQMKIANAMRETGSDHYQSVGHPMFCSSCFRTWPCEEKLNAEKFFSLVMQVNP